MFSFVVRVFTFLYDVFMCVVMFGVSMHFDRMLYAICMFLMSRRGPSNPGKRLSETTWAHFGSPLAPIWVQVGAHFAYFSKLKSQHDFDHVSDLLFG